MRDYSFSIVSEVAAESKEEYVRNATIAMESRFSHFMATPEQQRAWIIGFTWVHELASSLSLNGGPDLYDEFTA